MKRFLWLALCSFFLGGELAAQNFEIVSLQESYKGSIGEVIKAPLQLKNNTSRPLTLIIRKSVVQIGTSQRNYFCDSGICLSEGVEEYILKIDPAQTISHFQVALEAGLVPGISSIKYLISNRANANESLEIEVNFLVEEKIAPTHIYSSRIIKLEEVYPNPSSDYAYVNYKVLNDNARAKMILRNVLGTPVGEYDLPVSESRVKIKTEDLNAGIYFYTLYVDNKAVMTRKLVVRK